MVRDNGAWKIASAHFSANMFDNPLDGIFSKYAKVIFGAVLVLGLLLGFWLGRRKRG
jgi:hypothetical protein